MVHLNYTHLDEATQNYLLARSKEEIVQKFGNELQKYSVENDMAYKTLLEEEAIRNLYNYEFSFRI